MTIPDEHATLPTQAVFFCLFFISGFCGILYQIIWLRKAFSSFGVITPILSVVVSVFMLGLSLGSWIGGNWSKKWRQSTGLSPIFFYGIAELVIGLGAFATPILFNYGEIWLTRFGSSDSVYYLLFSAIIITISLLPWCFCMGLTYPAMLAYFEETNAINSKSFSFLYLANVLGSMLSAILTAVIMIETLGFSKCLITAGFLNISIALISFALGFSNRDISIVECKDELISNPHTKPINPIFVYYTLFLTGFCSMALEITWTRAFAPYLSTTIYAFAFILTIYLAATSIGSFIYRKHLHSNDIYRPSSLIVICILASIAPLLLTDPRMVWGFSPLAIICIALGIFVFSALMGYLTPLLIDDYSNGSPVLVGRIYALNIIGCILGPIVAGYVLLPFVGVKWTFMILSFLFILLFFSSLRLISFNRRDFIFAVLGIIIWIFSIFHGISYEEYAEAKNIQVRRDHVATVLSWGDGMGKRLLVNGYGMTHLSVITKTMAHLPLALHEDRPESALSICFGMGTTFRSLMSWGIKSKAVELVPSVKEAFSFYFPDSINLLKDVRGEIIIDDGRRYLKRTEEKFDVITIDPPPPMEAAGSSLLYSVEFYSLIKSKLNKNGIMQQWFPGGDRELLEAVVRSVKMTFPHVKIFLSLEGWGFHILASSDPINVPSPEIIISRMPETAKEDLMEWLPNNNILTIMNVLYARQVDINSILTSEQGVYINDNRPINEYYLLRKYKNLFLESSKNYLS